MASADGFVFGFEDSCGDDLHFMPLAIRYRLDLAGIKLGLEAWRALSVETRRRLLDMPAGVSAGVESVADALRTLCREGVLPGLRDVAPANRDSWSGELGVPTHVRTALAALGEALPGMDKALASAWPGLGELARYALSKLARSSREPDALVRALREIVPKPTPSP